MQLTTGRGDGDVKGRGCGEEGKRRERSRGWPTQRKRTESRGPNRILLLSVLSPRTLMPEGAVGRDHKVLG